MFYTCKNADWMIKGIQSQTTGKVSHKLKKQTKKPPHTYDYLHYCAIQNGQCFLCYLKWHLVSLLIRLSIYLSTIIRMSVNVYRNT